MPARTGTVDDLPAHRAALADLDPDQQGDDRSDERAEVIEHDFDRGAIIQEMDDARASLHRLIASAEGWARLTPEFQNGIARNREYYESLWGGVDRVVAADISGSPPDHAEATISYYFTDGRVSVERTSYRLVQDGAILKLDDSAVC
jgi:hypothetical protein